MSERLSLAAYQTRAVDALSGVIRKVAELHDRDPAHRKTITLKNGVTLLQSPTGSGKTLVLGRVLEGLRGGLSRPVVWLWFAPYAGLVTQSFPNSLTFMIIPQSSRGLPRKSFNDRNI